MVNEQEENFKIQDLERKIFTPARNRVMCEAFLKEAQRDPAGKIGKSIVFAVNQTHATELTKIFNEIQPGIAVTITSRIQDASSIAKEFRDGKRSRTHRRFRGHAFHRLQLPRPPQHRPDASDFFADRIHSNQRTRHAACSRSRSATPNTRRRISSCSISARSPNTSRKNTTTRFR